MWSCTAPWEPPEILHVKEGRSASFHRTSSMRANCVVSCSSTTHGWWSSRRAIHLRTRCASSRSVGTKTAAQPGQAFAIPCRRWRAARRLSRRFRKHGQRWRRCMRIIVTKRVKRLVPVLSGGSANVAGKPWQQLDCVARQDGDADPQRARQSKSFAADFTLNELHADPWFGCMTELADLPMLVHKRDEAPDEWKETIGYLADKGGRTAHEHPSHRQRDARRGRVHSTTIIFAMASLPSAEVIATVPNERCVPRPLLDRTTPVDSVATRPSCNAGHGSIRDGRRTSPRSSRWSLKPIKQASARLTRRSRCASTALKGIDVENASMDADVCAVAHARIPRPAGGVRPNERHVPRTRVCSPMDATGRAVPDHGRHGPADGRSASILHDRKGNLIGEEQ